MTATTSTDAWITFGYTIAGCWWAMRKGWRMSEPERRNDDAWWVR